MANAPAAHCFQSAAAQCSVGMHVLTLAGRFMSLTPDLTISLAKIECFVDFAGLVNPALGIQALDAPFARAHWHHDRLIMAPDV